MSDDLRIHSLECNSLKTRGQCIEMGHHSGLVDLPGGGPMMPMADARYTMGYYDEAALTGLIHYTSGSDA